MTSYQRYPDGVVYIAIGIVLGVALALAFGRCAHAGTRTEAVRPVPESVPAETEADNVTSMVGRERKGAA